MLFIQCGPAYGRHTRSFARSRVEIWYGAGGNEIKDEEELRIETFGTRMNLRLSFVSLYWNFCLHLQMHCSV